MDAPTPAPPLLQLATVTLPNGLVLPLVPSVGAILALFAISISSSDRWVPASFLPPPSPSKPHASFPAFYALYLKQHRQPLTKISHAVGTLLFLSFISASPNLLLALGAAMLVGALLCPLLRSHSHGAVEGLLCVAAFAAAGKWGTGFWRPVVLAPLSAYTCAWLGHWYVEKNRPATFIYPSYSLLGDFRMLVELAVGRIPFKELEEEGAAPPPAEAVAAPAPPAGGAAKKGKKQA